MNYKLLVLDIDGTLTNDKKEITPKTKAAIRRLQEAGVPVAIASGRPLKGVAFIADELEFDKYGSYVLAFNGARIVNWKTKETVYSKNLPISMPKRLYQEAMKYGVGILTYMDDALIVGTEPDPYMEKEKNITRLPICYHEDFPEFVNFPVHECMFTGEPDNIERIEPILSEEYKHEANVFRSEPYFLEIMPKNVDKAYCLAKLLEILGIKREETVCCGDGYNDFSMIQFAGMGVAMCNGQEAVKDIADYVTVHSNNEDGIAEVIDKFFA